MSEIVLDMGSGNTCRNDVDLAKTMIDSVVGIDSRKHKVIFKWQMWEKPQGKNTQLDCDVFDEAYFYAKSFGYETTSSVFDEDALGFLLAHDIPFVKIANRPDLWWLLGEVPRKIPVYVSNYPEDCGFRDAGIVTSLACVAKYPATLAEYEWIPNLRHFFGISDHTVGLGLWNKYHPTIWEKHFVLEHDESNLDGGPWAITPKELMEVL